MIWTWKKDQWAKYIEKYFECLPYENVYILGCFASNLTLYSQQVRAFNLIFGLEKAGKLRKGHRIAIIGAGAGGLAAAAAARRRGYEVSIFEKNAGPLELQINNRQRWIHPRIYDWPGPDAENPIASLPILGWKAGFANEVAEEIDGKWRSFVKDCESSGNPITEFMDVGNIDISLGAHSAKAPYSLYACYVDDKRQQTFAEIPADHIIIATGFGEESGDPWIDSYWAEDNYDAAFGKRKGRWLVSGRGDGALTDLMRLCIRRFRHDDVLQSIVGAKAIEILCNDLKKEEQKNQKQGAAGLSELQMSFNFSKAIWGKGYDQILSKQLRRHEQPVVLAYKNSAIYAGRSSILNRLIVAILHECKAFVIEQGDPVAIQAAPGARGGFEVQLGVPTRIEHFDRVIVRHGPKPEIDDLIMKWFPRVDINRLRLAWREMPSEIERDGRDEQWRIGFFGDETDEIRGKSSPHSNPLGAKIVSLTYHKEIKDDGSSLLTYFISGLEATDPTRPISSLQIHLRFAAGIVGDPKLGEMGLRLGLRWLRDPSTTKGGDPVEEATEEAHLLSGKVLFDVPLIAGSPAISFNIQIPVLNGDAMTEWEFEHLYRGRNMHVDGTPLLTPLEYAAAFIWCPVDVFTMRLSLPATARDSTPTLSMFMARDRHEVVTDDVLESGTLHLFPKAGSKWYPFAREVAWERYAADELRVQAAAQSKADEERKPEVVGKVLGTSASVESPRTWEFSTEDVEAGTCFALAWPLAPDVRDEAFEAMVKESDDVRRKLLAYRDWRSALTISDPMADIFLALDKEIQRLRDVLLRRQYVVTSATEQFELELMTFNDLTHKLELIVATDRSGVFTDVNPRFSLPFGLGLGGACYKDGGSVYAWRRSNERIPWPEYYLPVRGENGHEWMLAFPLDNPKWNQTLNGDSRRYSRGRQTMAILDISAPQGSSGEWFRAIHNSSRSELTEIAYICQESMKKIIEILRSGT